MPRINTGSSSTPEYYVSQLAQNKSVLTPLLAEETAKKEQHQLLHLLTFSIPGAANVRWVDSNYDVVFDGVTYEKFPFKFSGSDITTDGTIDKPTISLANVDWQIMRYVESYRGLQGSRLSIKTLYTNALDHLYAFNSETGLYEASGDNPEADPAACIDDEYIVDSYSANEQLITFQLDPVVDLQVMVPRRRYMVDTCYWRYKDPTTCKYAVTYSSSGSSTIQLGGCAVDVDTGALDSFVEPGQVLTLTGGLKCTIMSLGTGNSVNVNFSIPATAGYAPCTFDHHTACDMTFAACRKRGNEENFGGFPGISGSRRLYL